MSISHDDAAAITAECVAAIQYVTTFNARCAAGEQPNGAEFLDAIRPKNAAALRLVESFAAHQDRAFALSGPFPGINSTILLMGGTVESMAKILSTQGFDREARRIHQALDEFNAAAA